MKTREKKTVKHITGRRYYFNKTLMDQIVLQKQKCTPFKKLTSSTHCVSAVITYFNTQYVNIINISDVRQLVKKIRMTTLKIRQFFKVRLTYLMQERQLVQKIRMTTLQIHWLHRRVLSLYNCSLHSHTYPSQNQAIL